MYLQFLHKQWHFWFYSGNLVLMFRSPNPMPLCHIHSDSLLRQVWSYIVEQSPRLEYNMCYSISDSALWEEFVKIKQTLAMDLDDIQ